MIRQIPIVLTIVFLSFAVLFVSITQTAQVKYSFTGPTSGSTEVLGDKVSVNYHFPYPGRIAPDHPLWSLKAIRDRVWILITPKAERRAELDLLFANKRMVSADLLFKADKPELALSVLTKAEKYLESALIEEENARHGNVNTSTYLYSLNLASLKHREMIREMLENAPEDAKPEIIKTEDYSKRVYTESTNYLKELGIEATKDPFQGENQ